MAWAKGLKGFFKTTFGGAVGSKVTGGMRAGLGALGTARDNLTWGRALGRVGANVGLQGTVGAGLALATGNEDYLWMGVGMGAAGSAGAMFKSGLNPLFMAKQGVAGQVIGAFTGNPMHAPIATAGLAAGGALFKKGGMLRESLAGGLVNTPGYMANMARAPFAPMAAMRSLARTQYPAATPFVAGVLGGAGWSAAKIMSREQPSITEGVFPQGMNYAGRTGRSMGYNHMETAGLTLALHRTKNRIV